MTRMAKAVGVVAARDRVVKLAVVAAGLVSVMFIAWLGWTILHLGGKVEDTSDTLTSAEIERNILASRVEELETDVAAYDAATRKANRRLVDAGKKPVTVPSQPVAVPVVSGEPVLTAAGVLTMIQSEVASTRGTLTQSQRDAIVSAAAVRAARSLPDRALSDTELRALVRREVARIPVPVAGPAGAPGRDGRPPTQDELTAALAALCGGSCRGADGPSGPDGERGEQGPRGDTGADGRGVTSIDCTDASELVVTYSDGTTQTVQGARVCGPSTGQEGTS